MTRRNFYVLWLVRAFKGDGGYRLQAPRRNHACHDGDSIMGDENSSLRGEDGFPIFYKYSAYLQSVDNIIRYGARDHLGDSHEILLRHADCHHTAD
jgi:hypothetical protein